MHYKFERKVLLKENATWSDRLKQLKTSERQMLQNPFNIGWIQHFSSKNRTFRFIQPPAPTQLYDPRPSVPSPWPSGSASVYEISATKHVSLFTFSLLLWRQLFWNKLNSHIDTKILCQFSVQFCITSVISFSYNKEPLRRKTELRAMETFVNKVISPGDP